jgi:hypothetical protein
LYIDDLLNTAQQLKAEGKIRALGLAYNQSQLPLHQAYINSFDVLQFNNSPGIAEYNNIKLQRSNRPNIFFSAMGGGAGNMTPTAKLTQLFNDFPQTVVLCSTFNEKHLKENVKLASGKA